MKKLENKPSEAMRWLEKLTCGGSEFYDDPENCYNVTRKRLDSNHANLVKQQKRIRELEAIISENKAICK